MQFTAEIIANFLQGTVEGNPQTIVNTIAKIEEAKQGALVFLSNPKYEEYVYSTEASIIMVNNDFVLKHPINATIIRVENAYKAFASILDLYIANKPRKIGVRSLAFIESSATISEDVYIGEYTVVGENAKIGKKLPNISPSIHWRQCKNRRKRKNIPWGENL